MKRIIRTTLLAAVGATLVFGSAEALAQQQRQRPQRGQRGNFDPAQMRQRMTERLKEVLGVDNQQEWDAMRPLIEDVMTKQRDVRGRGMFGMFGGGRGGRQPGGRRGGDIDPAVQALQDAVESTSSSAADIKAKIQAVRDSRKKREGALQASRAKLRAVCTARQEARLFMMGILD